MQAEYSDLKGRDSFGSLSKKARDFIKDYCELGEVRFCDTCGAFIEGDFIWDIGTPGGRDFCSDGCMEESGYTRKDMLQDYYDTPAEDEDGYDELMEAKARLDGDGFSAWLEERFPELEDPPVFWTEDQFPFDRNEGAAMEALSWLREQEIRRA